MNIADLTIKAQLLGIELTDKQQEQFLIYAQLLEEWNEKINLTAITAFEEVVEKHFYDCLIALHHINPGNKACDVGTGAGFPGLVLKIIYPDLEVVLIEPTLKRCHFLQEVVNQLHLEKVVICNERAEDYAQAHRETFDFVTARAVANLPMLSELCIPLLKIGGTFLAMKGNQGMQEAEEAAYAIAILGCEKDRFIEDHLLNGDTRFNLIYQKKKTTPKQYPRPYARIKKKPLGK